VNLRVIRLVCGECVALDFNGADDVKPSPSKPNGKATATGEEIDGS
jgi:hypothetical protein